MGGYLNAREWLVKRKNGTGIAATRWSSPANTARLEILITLVWPEALVYPDQQETIAGMISETLFPDELTGGEIYKEARAIAAYLNSMT